MRWESRAFDSHAQQWNHGLHNCQIATPWILSLDADFILSPEWLDETAKLAPNSLVSGYSCNFAYALFGIALRRCLYPNVTCLFKRIGAHYFQDGHTQRLATKGTILSLSAKILHDDRKPLSRWLVSQSKYADQEAELILSNLGANLGGPIGFGNFLWLPPF